MNPWAAVAEEQQMKRKVATDYRGQALMPHAPKKALVEPEALVLERVTKALEAAGCRVFRNTVGFVLYMGRGITYGLGKGSADLVCIVPPMGRWLAVECKNSDGGKVSPEQEKWIAEARSYGAVAGVVSSPEEALELLKQAKRPVMGVTP